MRARIPLLIFATTIFACSFLGSIGQSVYAYKCKTPGTPLEELKKAAAVFVGKAIKVNENGSTKITEFEVERYWKGPGTKNIIVRQDKNLYLFGFTKGEKYVVYAYGEDEIETSRCTRTKRFDSAAFDLKELGEAKVPE